MTTPSKSLASTPPMGWNSWNTFGHHVEESVIREMADMLVSASFKDHGYEYIVIDNCWSVREGRDSNGDLVADPEKFPNGIQALADYVHDKGFKLGIYSDAAEKTCAGHPGSYGFADQSIAVAVINRGSRGEDVTVKARDLGLLDSPKLARNLWAQQDIADFKTELKLRVQPHETVLLKVSSQ